MILCDREIEAALDQERIFITPRPGLEFMNSTSVDLCLDGILDRWEFPDPKQSLGHKKNCFCPGNSGFKFSDIEGEFAKSHQIPTDGYELPPSFRSTEKTGPLHLVLGWTIEKIYLPHTSRLCARVEGKSSLGRMGLGVHITAPTIHAGFGFNDADEKDHGKPLRLEMWNIGPLPIVLTKNLRICQLIIEEVREVPRSGYSGQFSKQGPKPKSQTKQKGVKNKVK